MQSIIVFGGSRGGQNFIDNYCEKHTITAIVDNNKLIQGTVIKEIPIIAPEQLERYQYDYIIIASMFAQSITKQLLELGIPKEKIKYASKNSMKVIAYPFMQEAILERANRMIVTLSDMLKEVSHYFTFGTLLGIVRDGQLIPWDDDIDLAVFAEDLPVIKQKILERIDDIDNIIDTKMYMRYYPSGKAASLSIDCYSEQNLSFNINLDAIYVQDNLAKQELNETPLNYFQAPEKIQFYNHPINVPNDYEGYLTYTYGDWQTVKKHTSFYDNTLSFVEPKTSCISELFYASERLKK